MKTAKDVLRWAHEAQVIGIDEGQFLGPALLDVCERLARQGKRVIEQGADLDLGAANALEQQAFGVMFGTRDQKEGMEWQMNALSNLGLLSLREAISVSLKKHFAVSYDPRTQILIAVGVSEARTIGCERDRPRRPGGSNLDRETS
mgnify:CR=1 FL=1